jgi:integrase
VKTVLTDIAIRALKPGIYFDQKLPAFGIRVGPRRKTWLVVRGRQRLQTVVGHYPQIGLADARAKAKVLLVEPPPAASPPSPPPITFAEARAEYVAEHTGRPSTVKELRRVLTKDFMAVADMPLPEITDATLDACIRKLPPGEGRHAFRAARAMLRWCVRPPRRYIRHSPLEGMAPRGVEGRRTRILSDDEVARVLAASRGQCGALVWLMLLWGTRRGETMALRRDWIADGIVTIPGTVAKNGRPHTIPLLPVARAILTTRPEEGPFFFPGRWNKETHLNDGSWTKLHKELLKASATEGWTAHDLRRTFRSACARHGVRREIAERLLNHAQGRLDEIYDHYDYLVEKRNALGAIEKWVLRLMKVGKVEGPGQSPG